MEILITAPTFPETNYLFEYLNKNLYCLQAENALMSKFRKEKLTISLLISGVGINQTAYQLATCFATNKFDYAVQIGIGGTLDPTIKIGSVVQITTEEFADFGAEDGESFLKASDIQLINKNEFPFEEDKLKNNTPLLHNLEFREGLTFNTALGNIGHIEKIKNKFTGTICSMESASFFYACLQNKIPFHAVRSVSNIVEERNKKNWNIELAIQNVNDTMIQLIKSWK